MTLALKDEKVHFYYGTMTYQLGFIAGVVLSLFMALLSPLSRWIATYVITPEYFPNVFKRSLEFG
jgi:hypothetical protein